jgi:uncharacterized SAM-binding protein YcdF (DUF218 family)
LDARRSTIPGEEMDPHIRNLARKIWDYHHLHHHLEKADAILVLCSHDKSVAERGAQLYLEGWAPLLIFSGGLGAITETIWSEPEADQFAAIARELGVPDEHILIENKSTNTGDNILFTRNLLAEQSLDLQRFILVQKPYMERRSYATFKQLWPEKDVLVTSPQVAFDEYFAKHANKELTMDFAISVMVGDLQRIKIYPEKGFQIYQEISDEVWSAYEELVRAGYDKHLIKA